MKEFGTRFNPLSTNNTMNCNTSLSPALLCCSLSLSLSLLFLSPLFQPLTLSACCFDVLNFFKFVADCFDITTHVTHDPSHHLSPPLPYRLRLYTLYCTLHALSCSPSLEHISCCLDHSMHCLFCFSRKWFEFLFRV